MRDEGSSSVSVIGAQGVKSYFPKADGHRTELCSHDKMTIIVFYSLFFMKLSRCRKGIRLFMLNNVLRSFLRILKRKIPFTSVLN